MALLAAVLALFLTACRLDASVEVRVDEVGTGWVTLALVADAEAVARAPDLVSGMRLDDVRKAGWTVDGPTPRGDGGVEVRASKRFESASQLPQLLDEIAGPGVIFFDVQLDRSRSFDRTNYDFAVSIDPTPPLEAFSDDAVAALLDGNHFGRPIEDLLAASGPVGDVLGLAFTLTLPEPDDDLSASAGTWDDQDPGR